MCYVTNTVTNIVSHSVMLCQSGVSKSDLVWRIVCPIVSVPCPSSTLAGQVREQRGFNSIVSEL